MENKAILWLRGSYWVGAVVDFAAGLMMLVPALFAFMNRPAEFQPGSDYCYAMGMGAPLMFGWTMLLLWADRKPMERKGILPITLFVVAGEAATQVWGASVGFVSFEALLPTFVLQVMISALFLFSFYNARRVG